VDWELLLLLVLALLFPSVALEHSSMLNDCDRLLTVDPLNAVAGESTCMVVFLYCIDPDFIKKEII
jgi:hypothetical protein